MRKACTGQRKDGGPCGASPMKGRADGRCVNCASALDPAVKARLDAGRKNGGRTKHTRAAAGELPKKSPRWMKLSTVDDARVGYSWVIRRLSHEQIDSKTAHALVAALGGVVRALEGSDLEARLDALEQATRPA